MSTNLPRLSPSRSPWQLLYGAAHKARWHWYARHSKRLPRPVVSVGNLHWGGTGKTPLVAAIAGHLRDRGLQTAVLSRGYRSRGRGVRIVSTGEGPLLGPKVAGDEPVLRSLRSRQACSRTSGTRPRGLRSRRRLLPPPTLQGSRSPGLSLGRSFRRRAIVAWRTPSRAAVGSPQSRCRHPHGRARAGRLRSRHGFEGLRLRRPRIQRTDPRRSTAAVYRGIATAGCAGSAAGCYCPTTALSRSGPEVRLRGRRHPHLSRPPRLPSSQPGQHRRGLPEQSSGRDTDHYQGRSEAPGASGTPSRQLADPG